MKKAGKMIPLVLKTLTQKPNTIAYPFEKAELPEHYRGKLKFDTTKCIGCKMCMRDCPANAITIEKIGEKQFKATVQLDKCVYCGQCTDSCPRDALECTKCFELAQLKRENLKEDI